MILTANSQTLDSKLKKYQSKVVVLIFSATWCQPCKKLQKIIKDDISKYFPHVIFIKIDIDESDDLGYNVKHLPTTIIINQGKKTSTITGYNPALLIKKLQKM